MSTENINFQGMLDEDKSLNWNWVLNNLDSLGPIAGRYLKFLGHLWTDKQINPVKKGAVVAGTVGLSMLVLKKTQGFVKDNVPVVGKVDNYLLAAGVAALGSLLIVPLASKEQKNNAWIKVGGEGGPVSQSKQKNAHNDDPWRTRD